MVVNEHILRNKIPDFFLNVISAHCMIKIYIKCTWTYVSIVKCHTIYNTFIFKK